MYIYNYFLQNKNSYLENLYHITNINRSYGIPKAILSIMYNYKMGNISRHKEYILELCQEGHWTAEQIHVKIRDKYPWAFIGIGTVYRNLTELVNEGLIMKQHGLMDKMIYEKKKPHHGHIFCQNSGVIIDVDISKMNIPMENIDVPEGFCNLEVQVTFAGYFKDENSRFCSLTGKKL